MSSTDKRKSILSCVRDYQQEPPKRPRPKALAASEHAQTRNKSDADGCKPSTASASPDIRPDQAPIVAANTEAAKASAPSSLRSSNFYGSNRLLLIDARIARLRADAQRRLQGIENAPFERFALQRQAFAWAQTHELAANLTTFSVEHDATGKRSFIVSTYERFWQCYRGFLPQHRHYYEIIQEGHPCHLYFDLEFKKEYNGDVSGESLVDLLLSLTAQQLKTAIDMEWDPAWVMELESDAEHKFSRHLIIQIPGTAFANNLHVGHFVGQICKAAVDPDSGLSRLQVAKEDGTTIIVDTGVYTRNRAFRLFLSSKAGKTSILTSTGRFPNKAHTQKLTFMQSLICKVPPSAKLLRCFEEAPHNAVTRHGTGLSHTLPAASQADSGPSPYPQLDQFITCVCSQGGEQGAIRSWLMWDDIGVLLYNIKNNRWCNNIGRPHKSNGIYLIADIQAGVWHQRCYDPECRDYRSEAMPLPPAIVRSCIWIPKSHSSMMTSNEGVLANATEAADEAALLAALDKYESAACKNST